MPDLTRELMLMWALWPSELSVVVTYSIFFIILAMLGYRAYKVNLFPGRRKENHDGLY